MPHTLKPHSLNIHPKKHDTTPEIWNPNFPLSSPLFWPIINAHNALTAQCESWPTLNIYNQAISSNIKNKPLTKDISNNKSNNNHKKIKFVAQALACDAFEDEYEPKIYLTGNVQTRLNNWHDFFQVLVWNTFPKTKALLNEIHYQSSKERKQTSDKQRSKQENFVTLFDECGTIVLSTKRKHLDQVIDFEWNDFFVKNKSEFGRTIDCAVFGHAMYEKALTPYIGMTSHCLLLEVDEYYFNLTSTEKTQFIDEALCKHIKDIETLNTKSLTPLPLLGLPGWYQNQTAEFYGNTRYFRAGRRKNQ